MTSSPPGRLRRLLDGLYDCCGAIAAVFIVVLFSIVVAQMTARWMDVIIRGATNYAAYCLAAASFFALAHTLRRNALIRMRVLLNLVPDHARWMVELWCHVIGGSLTAYFCWYAIRGVRVSIALHDVSQGQDATPLWIPQLVLVIGSAVLLIAFLDRIVELVMLRSRYVDVHATPSGDNESA